MNLQWALLKSVYVIPGSLKEERSCGCRLNELFDDGSASNMVVVVGVVLGHRCGGWRYARIMLDVGSGVVRWRLLRLVVCELVNNYW